MAFLVPTFEELRAGLLRDIQALLPDAAVGADSDFYIRASALAAALEGEYQHQAWVLRQVFPDTADASSLERHASLRGLTRKQPNAATGTVTVSGTAGSRVALGAQLVDPSGLQFIASAALTLDGAGSGELAVLCQAAGAVGNLAAGTQLTFMSAPAGVKSLATVSALSGGTEAESDAELLARLLDDIRNPPSGGNVYDYKRWAREVAGISDAYVFPLRRGAGTVDVVIETGGGLPSDALIAAVQAHIDDLRPVTADVLVLAPTLLPVNIGALLTLSGISAADAAARVNTALATFFARLQVGEPVYRARLINLMMGVPGVVNVALTAPAADVMPRADTTAVELASLGTVGLL